MITQETECGSLQDRDVALFIMFFTAVFACVNTSISRMERRTDMYISTLRSYIEAMGGQLDIIARFPEGAVQINQFEDIENVKSNKKVSKGFI